ncbi:MAG: helix-turn-helix domain-containing protein [Emergencia sp.]
MGVSFDVIFKLCEVLDVTPKELFDFRDRYSHVVILPSQPFGLLCILHSKNAILQSFV